MLLLLAQLVAPPLQPGPARLPGPATEEQRDGPTRPPQPPRLLRLPPDEPAPGSEPPPGGPLELPPPAGSEGLLPQVHGLNRYDAKELHRILAPCGAITDAATRLRACAAALSSRLSADGYVNSRVYPLADPPPGRLEVVEGRIAEVRIESDSPRLARRLRQLLLPLRGTVLHLPSLERTVAQLQQLGGVGQLEVSLNRLGSDSTRAVLDVSAEPAPQPLRGEISLRNDGNSGSGQFRALATLVKTDLVLDGDILLLFGELDGDQNPDLGYSLASLSYSLPLGDRLSLTTAFGASRRNLVEALGPSEDLSFRQFQLLSQLEVTLASSLTRRWYGFAALSLNRTDSYLAGQALPLVTGAGADGWVGNGFLRVGLGAEGGGERLQWAASVFGLQGIACFSTAEQLQNQAFFGIRPGEARAAGGQIYGQWRIGPRWQLELRAAFQQAFTPLTSPMGLSLGSDNGLRGLPGQVVSGDSGLLGALELSWTAWRKHQAEIQLVPFLGAGQVHTRFPEGSFSESIAAGGLLVRWLQGRHWQMELGWVSQFGDGSRSYWNDWLLGSGLYSKLSYRF